MCFHLLDRLTFVGVSIGMGFYVKGKSMRCSVALKQYLNLSAKMGIMEGLWNWCTHRIMTILGSIIAR